MTGIVDEVLARQVRRAARVRRSAAFCCVVLLALGLMLLAPTAALTVREPASAPYVAGVVVDGVVTPAEYAGAFSRTLTGSPWTTPYVCRDGSSLKVAFDSVDPAAEVCVALDPLNHATAPPRPDDVEFGAGYRGVWQGWWAGHWVTDFGPTVPGFSAVFIDKPGGAWQAEFSIPYAVIGATAGTTRSIGFEVPTDNGFYWPSANNEDPSQFAELTSDWAVTYAITPSAGSGGSITPGGVQTVNDGSSSAFTITPNVGYHVAGVIVDNVSIGAVTSYTFTNVTANHTIAAAFAINTYTITPSAGANGSINPSVVQTVSHGSSAAFTITPNTGYHVADVLVDGVSVGAVTSYLFTNVTANHTIAASFAANTVVTFTITASAGANGSISPSSAQVVASGGSSPLFVITADPGYHANVTVDGVSLGAVSSFQFANVTSNHTIAASFAPNTVTYTITASAGANGSISPSGAQTISHGSSIAFTITSNSGYHVADVLADGVSVGAVTSYTFTSVTANHTIAASFAADAKPASSLTIKTSRTAAYIGQTFILSGLARPNPDMVGRNMHVDVKKPNKAYWAYSSARTIYVGPSGTAEWWYRYYLDPKKVASGLVRRGTYLFKAVYDGGGFLPCQSPTITIWVR